MDSRQKDFWGSDHLWLALFIVNSQSELSMHERGRMKDIVDALPVVQMGHVNRDTPYKLDWLELQMGRASGASVQCMSCGG